MSNKLTILFLGLALLIMASIIIIIQKPSNAEQNASEEIEMEIATIPEKTVSSQEDMISYQRGDIANSNDEVPTPQEIVNSVSEESISPADAVPTEEAAVPDPNVIAPNQVQ